MNKLDQTVVQQLKAIEASCPRLLNAMHYTPEALWGEIQALEYACQTFQQLPSSTQGSQLLELVAALRAQMAKQGLMDYKELDGFREKVVTIQSCARTLMETLK
jgi:hypothetical protein